MIPCIPQRYRFLNLSDRCDLNKTPVSVCGEIAGRPLEAITLAALGYRTLSMPVTGIGPVKAALLKLDASDLRLLLVTALLAACQPSQPDGSNSASDTEAKVETEVGIKAGAVRLRLKTPVSEEFACVVPIQLE